MSSEATAGLSSSASATASAPTPAPGLTPAQIRALFDILTHRETYSEIEGFKRPDAVTRYGYPFARETIIPAPASSRSGGTSTPLTTTSRTTSRPTSRPASRAPSRAGEAAAVSAGVGAISLDEEGGGEDEDDKSSSPVLQTLFTRIVLTLPWLRDLPPDFWNTRVQGILARFAEAELSESYDKGSLGLRKTLATGSSALIEMAGRGILGRVKRAESNTENGEHEYDFGRAEDLERAWDDAIQGLVYGDLVESACAHMTKTDDLEAHSPTIKGAALYSVYHLATFLHHIFVISPEGQYLLQLLQNVHGLIPYKMVKQTLRIGNAATMINGMVRLMLAKLSIGGITNWFGLTTNADDGMNLLQRIISLVLSWDAAEFKKAADKVDKEKQPAATVAPGGDGGAEAPSEEVLAAIRQFVNDKTQMEREAVRQGSLQSSQSIIAAVLEASEEGDTSPTAMSDAAHARCLEYYSALLSVRDRDAITGVLCRQQPDLFTSTIRELVNAYEPFIRMIHAGVDLREYLERVQVFVDDFIKAGLPKEVAGDKTRPASVDDYVELLMKNRSLMYSWINAIAERCPDVWADLVEWCEATFKKFGVDDKDAEEEKASMETRLHGLFQTLPESSKPAVLESLDAHAEYLSSIAALSRQRLQKMIDTSKSNGETAKTGGDASQAQAGPGIYLLRWQGLLDETPITPETPKGQVRKGRDVKHTLAQGKTTIAAGAKVASASSQTPHTDTDPRAPDVGIVVRELGQGFIGILQEVGGPEP